MKKALLISGALLALTSSTALAGGVNFAWNECLGGGGVVNKTFACNTNGGVTNVAVGSFILNNPIPDLVALEVVIDLQAQAASMPAWWTFNPSPGACRGSSLALTFDFSVLLGGCADPFGGTAGQGGLANYTITGNRARAIGVGAIDAGFPSAVVAGTEYYGVRMAVNNAKTVGTGSCAGCTTPVAIVLNSINAVGLSSGAQDSQGSSEFNGSPIANQCATFQSATPTTCQATPTQNRTWGAIKSIYR